MKRSARKGIATLAVARKLRELADYDMDDALDLVGLRRRRSATARFFSALGLVLGGVAVGTVVGMMLAPRAGRDMRQGPHAMPGTSRSGARGGYGATADAGTQSSSSFS